MDSIHDMGGMDGFGPLEIDPGEPVFKEPWEGRVFAINMAMGAWGKWNLDASRHCKEHMEPATYLASRCFERWLYGAETLAIEHGLITRQELEARQREIAAEMAAEMAAEDGEDG